MAEFDFAPRPPKQDDQGDTSPFAASKPVPNKANQAGPDPAADRQAARRNPADSQGMLAGLMSMATTMGMARHTGGHIDPINSPTGLLGMLKSAGGAKHGASDDHAFNLDLTRSTAGGALGGMGTGLGMVGGPAQTASRRESTSSAMKAIGGMARGTGGGLAAMIGSGGAETQKHMQWLNQGVKSLYKIER